MATFLQNYLRADRPHSMTRLACLVLLLLACTLVAAMVALAFLAPNAVGMAGELRRALYVVVVLGIVALLLRTNMPTPDGKGDELADTTSPAPLGTLLGRLGKRLPFVGADDAAPADPSPASADVKVSVTTTAPPAPGP